MDGNFDGNEEVAQTKVTLDALPKEEKSIREMMSPLTMQDVRVDNWGSYCLQRLHAMYEKGDFCDLIIQFHNNQILKVHRVVMNLCTEYFSNLERSSGLTSGMLVLPPDIEYQAVVTIVKFFYTGRLEVRGNDYLNEIYKTIKMLNVTILIKLLETHVKKPTLRLKKESPGTVETSTSTTASGIPENIRDSNESRGSTGWAKSITRPKLAITSRITKVISKQIPQGVRSKTVLARIQPQSLVRRTIQRKKLPIWKERKFSPATNTQSEELERWPLKDEPAKPTRFEWPDPDDDANTIEERSKRRLGHAKKGQDIFDAVKLHNLNKVSSDTPSRLDEKSDDHDEVPPKITRLNDEIETELAAMENSDQEDPEAKLAVPDNNTTTFSLEEGDQLHICSNELTFTSAELTTNCQPEGKSKSEAVDKENKSISSSEDRQLESNATNHSKIISEVLKKYPDLVKENKNIKLKIVQKHSSGKLDTCKDSRSRVSYIVLKSTSSADSVGASLITKRSSRLPGKLIGKSRGNRSGFWDHPDKIPKASTLVDNTVGPWFCNRCQKPPEIESTQEHEPPEEFETYFSYRRHLTENHGEKFDARICEHCGYKASKRNLLLHHMYTKHGVPAPKNCSFPHCDQCDYVGLSIGLLTKHKQTHETVKEFTCGDCSQSFKSMANLKSHEDAICLKGTKQNKTYECPTCLKKFARNFNLKTHIMSSHKDISKKMDIAKTNLLGRRRNSRDPSKNVKDIWIPQTGESESVHEDPAHFTVDEANQALLSGQVHYVNSIDGSCIEVFTGSEAGIVTPKPLVPSSEAEALTNVATSITASLTLDTQNQLCAGTEFVEGFSSDSQQMIYILESSENQDQDKVDLTNSNGCINMSDSSTGVGPFIVQDIHGNQFQRMTGIDENGKQIVYFQLSQEGEENYLHSTAVVQSDITEEDESVATDYIQGLEAGDFTEGPKNNNPYLEQLQCPDRNESSLKFLPCQNNDSVINNNEDNSPSDDHNSTSLQPEENLALE